MKTPALTLLVVLAVTAIGPSAVGCSRPAHVTRPDAPSSTSAGRQDDTAEARAVLEDFFAAWTAKDAARAEAHMAEYYRRGGQWRFDRLDRVEFGPIELSPEAAKAYLENGGRVSLAAGPDAFKAFRATATFYYLSGKDEVGPHGEPLPWVWYLERAKDGRWYVTNYGG
jgi:hypothetical protein